MVISSFASKPVTGRFSWPTRHDSAPSSPRFIAVLAHRTARQVAKATVLFAAFTAVRLPAQSAQQNISVVTGFHNSSDTDPFADKDTLDVTSASTRIIGLAGARATVNVFCTSQDASDHTYLGFVVTLTGAKFDTVNDINKVAFQFRFDSQQTINGNVTSYDRHRYSYIYHDVENAYHSQKLLIGLAAEGSEAALLLNLHEPKLYRVISQCERAPGEAKQADQDAAKKQEGAKTDALEQGCRAGGAGVGKITPPQILETAEPESTAEARKAQFVGNVQVDLVVDPNGRPTKIKVTKGVGLGLDTKAVEAVSRYKFKPAMQNCHAVPFEMVTLVSFVNF